MVNKYSYITLNYFLGICIMNPTFACLRTVVFAIEPWGSTKRRKGKDFAPLLALKK